MQIATFVFVCASGGVTEIKHIAHSGSSNKRNTIYKMPPAPPNFFPANRRRQRLDPTRHLQGRELWNKVRFYSTESHYDTTDNNASNTQNQSNVSNNVNWFIALLQAIAYEMQPFRIKPALHHVKVFICNEDENNNLKGLVSNVVERCTSILSTIVKVFNVLYQHAKQLDIKSIASFFSDNKSMLAKSTTIIIALRIYYSILLYLHELLHIGPMIIIASLLSLLYTIGLGDNTGAGSGIPSAYSVFNNGFRRIMGTVDGEELARQYAGGMAGALNNNNQNNRGNGGNVDGVIWNDNNNAAQEEEEQNLINERRRQRRLERLQQRRNENGEEEANAQVQPHDSDEQEDDNDEQNDAENRGDTAAGRRVTGKKARRKNNLEHRREMQRQRQLAANVDVRALGAEDRGELQEPLLFEE